MEDRDLVPSKGEWSSRPLGGSMLIGGRVVSQAAPPPHRGAAGSGVAQVDVE